MSDRPDDPDIPLAPFPTALPVSPFPPLEGEAVPYLETADGPASGEGVSADPMPGRTGPGVADPVVATAPARTPPAYGVLPPSVLALGRFAFPPGEPPDDEGVAARDRRWTSRILVVAAVFLLVFNGVSIQNWSSQQAPDWMTTTVRRLADVWTEQMALLGADQPREVVREAYERARDAEWMGEKE
ncbi:MAG: hypothetical protein Q8S03_06220 [Brevundimonas sp.]|uniref:hypothetical protein n=1 Tax=Brevundimonas sp. TaxID=1871086 RepID=UPI002735F1E5|nr:hypothetical protein [Brevundimonas sp.]MDP3404267.1 hypothetical protein [Brevundimonas sp.]